MILENHSIALKLIKYFALHIDEKFKIIKLLTCTTPEERILRFFKMHKKVLTTKTVVPFTRQQIANYTGLRVETVIRTLSRLKQENKVEIFNRKIYY